MMIIYVQSFVECLHVGIILYCLNWGALQYAQIECLHVGIILYCLNWGALQYAQKNENQHHN